MRLKEKLSVVLLIVLVSFSPAKANAATASDISKQLICQCGCAMVLSNCTHAECASREAMTALVRQETAQGKSEAEIIQSFVAQYGETVLAALPKKGFNLTAWLLPFAALLFGGVVIYSVLKTWGRQSESRQTNVVTRVEEDEEYRRRLEKELEKFTGRGFR